jgi:cell division septal protein FtsQ
MNQYGWSSQRSRSKSAKPALSHRERARVKRQQRARAHLDRIRSAVPTQPPRTLVLAGITAVSLLLGAGFGNPLVATARSWIVGEPVRLETISVSGAERLSPAAIAESTGLTPGAALDSIDSRVIEQSLSEHPWIADARALRLPTGQLLIEVTERVARAVVVTENGELGSAVDASGMPFAPAEEQDLSTLPKLKTKSEIESHVADEQLARAIALAYQLPEFDLPLPTELSIAADSDPVGFTLHLPDFSPQIIIGWEDFETRLAKLARLIEENLEEVGNAQTLDLRFADQAVLRGSSPPKEATQAAAARGGVASSKARPTG